MWGQAEVEFIVGSSQKIDGEIIPMAVLKTNRVEEGGLGMVTTFCCQDQAKVESSEVLSSLHQWDSPELILCQILSVSSYMNLSS